MGVWRTRYRTLGSYLSGSMRALDTRRDWRRLSGRFRRFFSPVQISMVKEKSLNEFWVNDPVASYLKKHQENIDLSFGIFLISRESFPEYSHKDYQNKLLKMAIDLKVALVGASSPEGKIERMNDFFFGKLGLQACSNRDTESLLANLLVPEVLRRGRGHCLGLGSLYLVLAQLVKLPIYGVVAPGHFFCRYDNGEEQFNIEMTLRGARWSDDLYQERYGLDKKAIEKGIYLRSLDDLEVLVEILNNRGNYFWRRGRQDDAARDIGRATKVSKNFARGYAGKGFMALCRGQIATAVLELGRAVEIDPWSARATLHLGEALLEAGQVERSVAALKGAVALDGELSFGWSMLGRALAQKGEPDEAHRAHERAVSLDRDSCLAWNNFGVFLASIHKIEKAVNALVQSIEAAPDFPTAAANLAKLKNHDLLRDFEWVIDEVIDGYQEHIDKCPADHRSYLCLARFLYELGWQEERALALAEKACALCEDAAACEMIALLTYRQQQFGLARQWALRGLSRFPAARTRRRMRSMITRIDQRMQLVYEQ
jgi:tetratricopeptide (TPR) repeat protein